MALVCTIEGCEGKSHPYPVDTRDCDRENYVSIEYDVV